MTNLLTAIYNTILIGSPKSKVYKYERWAVEWSKMLSMFKDVDGRINTWMISRKQTSARKITYKELSYVFQLTFVYGLDDDNASELVFQDIIESVINAFDIDETLGGACYSTHSDWGLLVNQCGVQVQEVDARMFGSVLCHYANCKLGVITIKN